MVVYSWTRSMRFGTNCIFKYKKSQGAKYSIDVYAQASISCLRVETIYTNQTPNLEFSL